MRIENKLMMEFLKNHGIKCKTVKFIPEGSMRNCWLIDNTTRDNLMGVNILPENKWTQELIDKLTSLGFKSFDNEKLSLVNGQGNLFSVWLKHPQLTSEFVKTL